MDPEEDTAPKEEKKADKEGGAKAHGAALQEVLMKQAYEQIAKEQYAAAADTFEDILKRFAPVLDDNERSVIHSEAGLLYYWLGDYPAARNHAEHAVALGDGNDQACVVLGKIAVAEFQFDRARGLFSRIDVQNPDRYLGLCLVSLKLRDTQAAQIFLHDAVKSGHVPSTNIEFRVYQTYLHLLTGDPKLAILEARELVKKTAREPMLTLLLAEVFVTAGNAGEAKAIVKKVEKRIPNNDAVFAILAWASNSEEEFDRARDAADEAVRLNPRNAYAKTVQMKIATREGQYERAQSIGENIIAESPEYSLAHANLGDVYFNQGRYELAELEYDQSAQLMNSQTKGARLRQARMKYIDGDFAAAAQILDDLVDSYHNYYDDAMCDLLLCYDALQNEEKKSEIMDKMTFRKAFYKRTEQMLEEFEARE